MSERTWRTLLGSIPKSEPREPIENVVPLRRMTLDEHERRLADRQNKVIELGAGVDRAVIAYNTALDEFKRERIAFAERLKESGVVATFPMEFPEAELSGE